ncbi:hypothetical protein VTH06DRAFT_6494 [Thermothelomyces fergusii]
MRAEAGRAGGEALPLDHGFTYHSLFASFFFLFVLELFFFLPCMTEMAFAYFVQPPPTFLGARLYCPWCRGRDRASRRTNNFASYGRLALAAAPRRNPSPVTLQLVFA